MPGLTVTVKRPTDIWLIGLAFVNFIALGLPGGLLGVAWPSIRASFHLSLDALGVLLISSMIGFLLSSFNSGHIASRIGIGSLLLIGSLARSIGLLGYAVAPIWWAMVLLGLVSGLGGGLLDAGTNAYYATNHSARLMNWLHASFGLGATLGPLLMTTVLNLGLSWRLGYSIAGALQGLLVIAFIVSRGTWQSPSSEVVEATPGSLSGPATVTATLKAPTVWLGIVLFLVYAGIEATTGQWSFTLLTEARSVAVSTAGFWVSLYWGSFTAGRLLFGSVADRLKLVSSLRLCMVGAIGASILIWVRAADVLSLLGLGLMGLALAPVFPLLVSATPRRVGSAHSANAVGFQVAAASLGIGVLPALAGVLAERLTLEIIGPFLLAASVAMFLLHEKTVHGKATGAP